MTQVALPAEYIRDPFEKRVPGIGVGRDGCRTPMQWDDGPNTGFSESEPWLPVAHDFRVTNVANQARNPASILNLYRNLIALRRSKPILQSGAYRPLVASGDVLLFVREKGQERLLVALNMGQEPAAATFPSDLAGKLLLSTWADRAGEDVRDVIDLRPSEGVVLEVNRG
jgi:alpha-glucosidase